MRILIVTQKIDIDDPILGFFHRWVVEFAKHFNQIIVICLYEGKHYFPNNVRVLSLGKEEGVNWIVRLFLYIGRFYKYIWTERKNYNAVFVHMNQEYVLLGAPFWKLLGKKVTMWRNHHFGNMRTRIAVFCSDKVFCTSRYSFTAQFKKTVLMPVGIDVELFKPDALVKRTSNSILFLGRISPVKRPDILIEAVSILKKKNILIDGYIYGNSAIEDKGYFETLKQKARELDITQAVHFHNGLPNEKTPAVYKQYWIFINGSPSGMYDKTIFEAMSCAMLLLTSNKNLKGKIDDMFLFEEGNSQDLSDKITHLLSIDDRTQELARKNLRQFVLDNHSLKSLGEMLFSQFKKII